MSELTEKLQSIIDGKTTGNDAVTILRAALEKYKSTNTQLIELGQLIGEAEDFFIYGKAGRSINKTYR